MENDGNSDLGEPFSIMNDFIMRVDNVSFQYHADGAPFPVLDSISLCLEMGEIMGVIGPSGCGKSTLLDIVAGLREGYSGNLNVNGSDGVGYMFQSPTLVPWLTVWDNIVVSNKAHLELAEELLVSFGLSDARYRYPRQLSGGMQQRAALARSLSTGSHLLLLDEPFTGSDISMRRELGDRVVDIVSKKECSCILVSHDVSELLRYASRIIVLSKRPATIIAEHKVPIDVQQRVRLQEELESFLIARGNNA